ncbi:MAG: hypothetical protein D6E12_10605 [Desulfovibrio sp.]|nr:MAG: hypothetical protein D6E12_10605 [Desulfovibrio sp.]
MRAQAETSVLRPGFFDFLTFVFKILGSFIFLTDAPTPEIMAVLERYPHPQLNLRYLDLIERVMAPEAEFTADMRKGADGLTRHGCRLHGPHVTFGPGGYSTDADAMVEDILALRGESNAPVVFFGCDPGGLCGIPDGRGIHKLFEASQAHRIPVLVFDFGFQLSQFAARHLTAGSAQGNPYFSMINIRDYYQAPVMLELLGLRAQWEPDMHF